MTTYIEFVDNTVTPRRITAFRESRPDCPDGIAICLGGLRLTTTVGEATQIAEAIERALTDLAPARGIPVRKTDLASADVSGIAYQAGESA